MTHGHLQATVDPLQLQEVYAESEAGKKFNPGQRMKELIDPKFWGFTDADLNKEFFIDISGMGGIIQKQKKWVLRDLIKALEQAYCANIGLEYMHIPHKD